MGYRHVFYGDARPVPEPVSSGVVVAVAFFGAVLMLAAMGVSGAVRSPGPTLLALCVLAAAVTGCASARLSADAGVAFVCWLLYNGFVLPEAGELGWDSADDSRRIGFLFAAAVLGTVFNRVFSAYAAYGRVDPDNDEVDPRA